MIKDLSESKVKIDTEAFTADYRPKIGSIVSYYSSSLYNIGRVVAHNKENRYMYSVHNFVTDEIETLLSNSTTIICGDGCSTEGSIYLLRKEIRSLENLQILAKKALPVLNGELESRLSNNKEKL